eukprot:TRINITY_DN513_c0_g1_i2.p1 TRINITY_DN513_c0_g1~~TRINITY_DN513_c0_g1_i2.p1  ORF type:complete len:113 (-),score=22.60 TRINITY_DN513_c0_g1_i2:68-367(-)
MSRPEHIAPPDVFYNEHEALKYTNNTRMIEVQTQLTERAIELLALPDESPRLILDIGCGSGLSGDVIESFGHNWIGVGSFSLYIVLFIVLQSERQIRFK